MSQSIIQLHNRNMWFFGSHTTSNVRCFPMVFVQVVTPPKPATSSSFSRPRPSGIITSSSSRGLNLVRDHSDSHSSFGTAVHGYSPRRSTTTTTLRGVQSSMVEVCIEFRCCLSLALLVQCHGVTSFWYLFFTSGRARHRARACAMNKSFWYVFSTLVVPRQHSVLCSSFVLALLHHSVSVLPLMTLSTFIVRPANTIIVHSSSSTFLSGFC